jgi:rhodanese-related sulfurtransferase
MKRSAIVIFLALSVMLFTAGTPLWAAEEEETFTPYTKIVEGEVVKEIVDGKAMGLVIDSRPKQTMYDKEHIPGAISLPTSQFEKMKGLLPADKNALIVFYCGGLKCALSHKAAFKSEEMGYTNVRVYAKGYPDWKQIYGPGAQGAVKAASEKPSVDKTFKAGKEEGSIDFAEFKKIAAETPDNVLFLDVRDPKEFATGSFKNAVNIPTEELEQKLPDMKAEKPIIYVCGTGARSGEAYYMTKDKRPDITEVYYVDGEMTWDKQGGYTLEPPK